VGTEPDDATMAFSMGSSEWWRSLPLHAAILLSPAPESLQKAQEQARNVASKWKMRRNVASKWKSEQLT
jgi:hypothetical protein